MSLFDSASLVVTPSGYKEDKLYSIKPTDGSGDLVVTRATTATRVNSSGLIEVVPYNLLTYSNTFTNSAWVKNACTITANSIISPDGTQNASKLVESTANDSHHIYQNAVASGVNTFSFYAKAGERNFVYAYADSVGQGKCFDLQNGTVGANIIAAPSNATITSVGNGWYRCTITLTIGSASALRIGACSANGTFSYLGNGTSGIYIYGAQLNSGATAREYFSTTDRLDVPRLDYTNSTCPSILVEPQRTNVLTYSNDFTNAIWTKDNVSLTSGITSPSGINNAFKLVESATTGVHSIYQTFVTLPSSVYSTSMYVKKGERFKVAIADRNTGIYVAFNLNTGTIIASNSLIGKIELLNNDWYRLTVTTSSAIAVYVPQFFILDDAYTTGFPILQPYLGNATKGVFISFSQLEAGSYATSYIPTIASSVTRNADVISKTGISSLIGQTEGTIFLDLQYSNTSGLDMFFSVRPNSSNKIEIFRDGGVIYAEVAATNSISISSSKPIGSYKIAFAYKSGSTALYINGTLISQSTTTFNFTNTLSDLYLNSRAGTSFIESANFKTAAIFKTRLTNDELAQLTTI